MVKTATLVAVAAEVVTRMGPVVAAAGTTAVSWFAEFVAKIAA
jgi:hypothetical protein